MEDFFLIIICWVILGRNHINATRVRKIFHFRVILTSIQELILGRNHINAAIVRELFQPKTLWFSYCDNSVPRKCDIGRHLIYTILSLNYIMIWLTVDIVVFQLIKISKEWGFFIYFYTWKVSTGSKKYDVPSIKDIREKRDGRVLNKWYNTHKNK